MIDPVDLSVDPVARWAFQQANDAFVVFDRRNGQITQLNPAAALLTGRSPVTACGTPVASLFKVAPTNGHTPWGTTSAQEFGAVLGLLDGREQPVRVRLCPLPAHTAPLTLAILTPCPPEPPGTVVRPELSPWLGAVDQLSVGVVLCDARDPEVPILHVNPAYRRMVDWEDSSLGRPLLGLRTDDPSRILLRQALREQRAFQMEVAHQRADESENWLHLSVAPVGAAPGPASYLLITAIEITGQRQSAEELRHQRSLFQAALESLPVQVWMRDEEGRGVVQNLGSIQTWGDVRGQLLQNSPLAPEVVSRWHENIHRARRGEVVRRQVRHTIGFSPRAFEEIVAPLWHENRIAGVIGVHIDITERMELEDTQRRHTEILQNIVEHIPLMLVCLDSNHQVIWGNAVLENTLGWSIDELRRQDRTPELYPDPGDLARVHEHMREANAIWRDFQTRTRDGRSIHTTWAGVRLSDGSLLAFGNDITERVRTEHALQSLNTRYRLASQYGRVATWESWGDSTTCAVDPILFDWLGYPPRTERLLWAEWQSYFHPDDWERAMQVALAYWKREIPDYNVEMRLRHRDGSWHWFLSRGCLIPGMDGEPARMCGAIIDISDRKSHVNAPPEHPSPSCAQ